MGNDLGCDARACDISGTDGSSMDPDKKSDSLSTLAPSKKAEIVSQDTTRSPQESQRGDLSQSAATQQTQNVGQQAVAAKWIKPGGAEVVSTKTPERPILPGNAGEYVFVIGGMGIENGEKNQLKSVEHFDFDKQDFFESGQMGTRRLGSASAYIPGHGLFVCGGFDGKRHLSTVEMLNIKEARFEQMPPMPQGITFAGAVSSPSHHHLVC